MRWKRCRQMNKELRDWYIQHGICVVCGHEKAVPNRKRCWDCLDKAAEWTANYKANMTEEQKEAAKEKRNKRQKKKYAERKVAGKCTRCGKKMAVAGKTQCTECLLKSRRTAEKYRRKKGAVPKILFGDGCHCAICGKDTENKKLCDKCYRNATHKLENGRERIKGSPRSHRLVFGKATIEAKEPERKRKEENL